MSAFAWRESTRRPVHAPLVTPSDELALEIRALSVSYGRGTQAVRAVRGVDLEIRRGEIVGLAGESGSGKSTLGFAIARLLRPPGEIIAGSVLYHGPDGVADLAALSYDDLRRYRWEHIAIVFQSAMNALNPVQTIGSQINDVLKAHRRSMSRGERQERIIEVLRKVAIPPNRVKAYPHELSGGMRQRAMIAMALVLDPSVIVMDEPTTALDVVTQRRILKEIQRLQQENGFTVIFISHDLSLLLEIADRVAIMYAGRLVEVADAPRLLAQPAHPYTRGLLGSFPSVSGDEEELTGIPGSPPDLRALPLGCAFAARCPDAMDVCRRADPQLAKVGDPLADHAAACWLDGAPAHAARAAAPWEVS